MTTDRELLKSAQIGEVLSTKMATPEVEVRNTHRRSYVLQITDGGTAGTNADEVSFDLPFACKFISASVTAPVAVAGHASNNKTITVAKRTAGGTAAPQASIILTVANALTALAPMVITATNGTLTVANFAYAAGDSITVKAVANASGIAIASATAYATVRVTVEEI